MQAKVREAAHRVEQAEQRLRSVLSLEESRELRQLHRALARLLHSDLNGELDEGRKRLWVRVQVVYANGDLAELRILRTLAEGSSASEPVTSSDQLTRDTGRVPTERRRKISFVAQERFKRQYAFSRLREQQLTR